MAGQDELFPRFNRGDRASKLLDHSLLNRTFGTLTRLSQNTIGAGAQNLGTATLNPKLIRPVEWHVAKVLSQAEIESSNQCETVNVYQVEIIDAFFNEEAGVQDLHQTTAAQRVYFAGASTELLIVEGDLVSVRSWSNQWWIESIIAVSCDSSSSSFSSSSSSELSSSAESSSVTLSSESESSVESSSITFTDDTSGSSTSGSSTTGSGESSTTGDGGSSTTGDEVDCVNTCLGLLPETMEISIDGIPTTATLGTVTVVGTITQWIWYGMFGTHQFSLFVQSEDGECTAWLEFDSGCGTANLSIDSTSPTIELSGTNVFTGTCDIGVVNILVTASGVPGGGPLVCRDSSVLTSEFTSEASSGTSSSSPPCRVVTSISLSSDSSGASSSSGDSGCPVLVIEYARLAWVNGGAYCYDHESEELPITGVVTDVACDSGELVVTKC